MKTIIAGSRCIKNYDAVKKAIEDSGFEITEVVSGAAQGVDLLGEAWADTHDIPVKRFPANWKNLKVKGAVVRENRFGKYNATAGIIRNERMAKYAEALICLWDGESKGSENMISFAHKHNLKVFVQIIKEDE